MRYCKGVQKIEVFEDDLIIKSGADGVTNVEEIIWLKEKLLEILVRQSFKKPRYCVAFECCLNGLYGIQIYDCNLWIYGTNTSNR